LSRPVNARWHCCALNRKTLTTTVRIYNQERGRGRQIKHCGLGCRRAGTRPLSSSTALRAEVNHAWVTLASFTFVPIPLSWSRPCGAVRPGGDRAPETCVRRAALRLREVPISHCLPYPVPAHPYCPVSVSLHPWIVRATARSAAVLGWHPSAAVRSLERWRRGSHITSVKFKSGYYRSLWKRRSHLNKVEQQSSKSGRLKPPSKWKHDCKNRGIGKSRDCIWVLITQSYLIRKFPLKHQDAV
jgi:hypothetical protein